MKLVSALIAVSVSPRSISFFMSDNCFAIAYGNNLVAYKDTLYL
jgi:hypothetical protein